MTHSTRPTAFGLAILLSLALVVTTLLPAPDTWAGTRELKKVRFAIGTQVVDPLVCNIVIGKVLGWYEEEGIDFSVHPTGAAATVQQGVLAGSFETGVLVPGVLLPVIAKGSPLPLKFFYNYTPRFKYEMIVREDSPIKDIRELKGKVVGVESLGSTVTPVGQAMFKGLGIDPVKDVKWVAAPAGAPAGVAIQRGDVDGYVSYDTHSARLTNLGFKYRVLPYTVPAELKGIAGFYVGARIEFIQANRELLAGFARTIAKGTVFALANPDAAARAFFKIAPEAVPKGKSQDEAVVEIVRMVQSRAKNWRRDEPHPWGLTVKEELEADARFLGVADKVDVSTVFTNEFVEAANTFDAAKIQEQARNYKK